MEPRNYDESLDCQNECCQEEALFGNSSTADSIVFSVSQDAEPSIIEGGIYSYENNAVYPKFYDTDTSVEEADEKAGTLVLTTTQPLRPFFRSKGYGGLQNDIWPVSESEFISEANHANEVAYSTHGVASIVREPRRPVGKVSTGLVTWNVLNMMMNLSILAMPFAVAIGGVVTIAIIPLVGMMSGYTGKLLIDCMYEHSPRRPKLKSRVRLDYIELGQDFSNRVVSGKIIHVLQVIDMLAACILNLNVLGALFFEIFHELLNVKICLAIGVAIALPTFFIKKLSLIAWMQLVGVTCLVVGLCLIEGYCLANLHSWTVQKLPICDFEKLPISIGIIIFAFGIHPALPGIEQQMNKPKQYRPMLALTFSIAIIVKMLVAVTNSLMYGRDTHQVITIDLEYHYGLGIVSAVFICISVLCFFSLPTFVIMEGIDHAIAERFPFCQPNGNGSSIWLSVFNRLMIMGISLAFAIFIPHFALVMAFFGNTTSTLLSLTIPCMFHLRMKKDRLRWYHYLFSSIVIVLSICSMLTGVFFTCKEIIKQL